MLQLNRLREVLKGYEQWEADVIGSDGEWEQVIPLLSEAQHRRLIELQRLRNAALNPEPQTREVEA